MRYTLKEPEYIQKWFAWHPIKIGNDIIWWETVYRYFIGAGCGDGFYIYAETREDCLKNIKEWRGE